MLSKIKNLTLENYILILVALGFAFIFGSEVKNLIGLYGYTEIDRSLTGVKSNRDFEEELVILFGMFVIYVVSISGNGLFGVKSFFLLLFISIIGQAFNLDKEEYRLKMMETRYLNIIAFEKEYEKSENAEKLRIAIKENKPTDFIKVLADINDNTQISEEYLKEITEIVMKVTPENEYMLKELFNDSYLTINEYKNLRDKILKDVEGKDLNINQIVLLRNLNKYS